MSFLLEIILVKWLMPFLPSALFNSECNEYFYLTHNVAEILPVILYFMIIGFLVLPWKPSQFYRKMQFTSLVKRELEIDFHLNSPFSFVSVTVDWLPEKRVATLYFHPPPPNLSNVSLMQGTAVVPRSCLVSLPPNFSHPLMAKGAWITF